MKNAKRYTLYAIRYLFLLALCFFLLFFVISSGRIEAYPFESGEKLTYTVKWSGAPLFVKILGGESVAKLVLEVKKESTQTSERSAYLFSWELKTTGLLSWFSPWNERRESYVDIDTLYPYEVTIYGEEGKNSLKNWVIKIDQQTGKALIRDEKNKWGETKLFSFPIFDIPSLIYWLRTRELKVGKVFSLFLLEESGTESGKEEIGERKVQIKVTGKKEIYIGEELYSTFLCEEVDSKKIKVWFSDDERHLPVKIEVATGEGALIAEIVQ